MGEELFEPAYVRLMETGELEARVAEATARLAHCDLCPRACGVDRTAGEMGSCGAGARARLASYGPHHGEEAPLRGWRGSGTIFFARCNLHCQFCQNHDISQDDAGAEVAPEQLAAVMLELQEHGCHNINLVSPSHVVPPILAAVLSAARSGLRLPLVYNTGGYDALETLRLLDGVIDIYMPDVKYADAVVAQRFSLAPDYPAVNQAAVREMFRQVGDLRVNARGVATRGLLVRHLVLPDNLAGTEEIARFLATGISPATYVNVMDQYRPAYRARSFPALSRPVTPGEFREAVQVAVAAGLHRLDERRPRR